MYFVTGARDQNRTGISTLARLRIDHYTTHACLDRNNGIEPSSSAWKAEGLPLTEFRMAQPFREDAGCLFYLAWK